MSPSRNPLLTRRRFLGGVVGVGLTGTGSAQWAKRVEPNWTQVVRLDVPLRHLPAAFDGFTIAQISDIHIEGGDMRAHFPKICERVSSLNPDCIVITGDFITYPTNWAQKYFVRTLPLLTAKEGVFGVRGNHDVNSINEQPRAKCDMRAAMSEAGVRELFNDVHTFKRGSARLHLAGVDDPWLGQARIHKVEAKIPAGEAAVLLAHEPDLALEYSRNEKFGLMLSGHSHGGQVCWPGGIPIQLPPLCQRFPRGMYQTKGMWHYTNRGLGTVGPPVRFCARPEITVFRLRAS